MRLSKNFNFVKDNEILKMASELEERFLKFDYKPIPNLARKIIEAIFIKEFQFTEDNLSSNIHRYKKTFDQPIVLDALYQIKKWGNNNSHYNTESEELNFTNLLYILKSVSIFLQEAYIENPNFTFSEVPYINSNIIEKDKNAELMNSINSTELKIKKTSFINWFKKEHIIFKIPFYQRNYTWSETQLNTLIEDVKLRIKDRHQHYFGVIAIKKEMDGDNIIYKIIDGQQRITTSLLLLKAAHDNIKDRELKKITILDELFSSYKISNRYINESAKKGQKEELKRILSSNVKKFEWRYGKNHKYFYDFFDDLTWEEIYDFVTTFINKFDVAKLEYDIDSRREMDIFENMNSKGTELKEWDLIRNHIFNMINVPSLSDVDKVKIMENNFIYEFCSGIKPEKQEEELSKFINEWIYNKLTKTGETFKDFDRFTIYNNFKLIFTQKIKTIQEYEALLDSFKSFGLIYKSLLNKDVSSLENIFSEVILRWNNIASKQQIYFVVFNMFERFGSWNKENWIFEDTQILELIRLLDSILIRIEVTKGFGHSLRTQGVMLCGAIQKRKWKEEVLVLEKSSEIMHVSDQQFKTTLLNGSIKQTLASKLLQQIDSYLIDKNGYGVEINFKKPSVEHVMPISNEKWIDFLKDQSQEWENDYNECINLLGNFYILPQKLNTKISNNNFERKKKYLLEMKTPSILGDEKEKIISLKDIAQWTFEIIKRRNSEIVNLLCSKIYNLK